MTIDWPARSRADYPIPASALSAKITVTDSSLAGGVTWTVERDAARTEAHSVTYTAPDALPVKHLFAAIRFYTQPGGAGSWVSECLVNAPVDAAGDGLPTITTGSGVAFVTAVEVAPLSLAPGETKPVQFTAKSTKDAAVALTPGSAFVSVVSGQDKVELIDGDTRQVKGLAPGTARLRVVVDGITGEAEITVASPVQVVLDPPAATVAAGGTQQFNAVVTGAADAGVTWVVQEGNAGGSVTAGGLYTAPATPGTYHVVATAKADASKNATAIVTVTPAVAPPLPPIPGDDETAVRARIDRTRQQAEAVVVDGSPGDWTNIPAFGDPSGDSQSGNAGLDITEASIAPLADALLVRIRTAGTMPDRNGSFWIDLDYRESRSTDIRIGFNPRSNQHTVYAYSGDQRSGPFSLGAGVSLVIKGDTLEAKVRYENLRKLLPSGHAADLDVARLRPWARVKFFSWNGSAVDDQGAAVGCFQLLPSPTTLDSALPQPVAGDKARVKVPVTGIWLVGQGGFTESTHKGFWAYDLNLTDSTGALSSAPSPSENGDYYSFGQPLFAPVTGVVSSFADVFQDNTPGSTEGATGVNYVTGRDADNHYVRLAHNRQGSAVVKQGDPLNERQPVAQVGNSGNSPGAHLHLDACTQDVGGGSLDRLGLTGLPVALKEALVGLNPTKDDPWARKVADWDVREGYYISHVQ